MDFGPISPIAGALAGAAIGGAITYFYVVKRKAVAFWISKSEDLTLPLQRHNQQIVLKIGNDEMFEVDKGRDDQNGNEEPVSDSHLPGKKFPNREKKQRGQEFNAEISKRDSGAALGTTPTQEKPA